MAFGFPPEEGDGELENGKHKKKKKEKKRGKPADGDFGFGTDTGGFGTDKNDFGGGFDANKNDFGGGFGADKNDFGGGFATDTNDLGGGFATDTNDLGGGFGTDKNDFSRELGTEKNDFGGAFDSNGGFGDKDKRRRSDDGHHSPHRHHHHDHHESPSSHRHDHSTHRHDHSPHHQDSHSSHRHDHSPHRHHHHHHHDHDRHQHEHESFALSADPRKSTEGYQHAGDRYTRGQQKRTSVPWSARSQFELDDLRWSESGPNEAGYSSIYSRGVAEASQASRPLESAFPYLQFKPQGANSRGMNPLHSIKSNWEVQPSKLETDYFLRKRAGFEPTFTSGPPTVANYPRSSGARAVAVDAYDEPRRWLSPRAAASLARASVPVLVPDYVAYSGLRAADQTNPLSAYVPPAVISGTGVVFPEAPPIVGISRVSHEVQRLSSALTPSHVVDGHHSVLYESSSRLGSTWASPQRFQRTAW